MKRLFKWFLMLNKRLYKKPVFIAILLLIPLSVSALVFASGQQNGFVRIALAQENSNDTMTSSIINEFLEQDSLIDFSYESTPDNAIDAVESGRADVAWIFPDDMASRVMEFTTTKSQKNAIAKVVVRESNVFTQITQEKLTAVIFRHCAKAQFIDYARQNLPELDTTKETQLSKIYDDINISAELFEIKSLTGKESSEESANFITAPIRGLLSILILVCAMAATLFYMQDESFGTFSLVKNKLMPAVALGCILIATINICAVVIATLFITNLSVGFFNELLCILIYSICVSLFCLFLKELLSNIKLYATIIPVLVIAMTVICPIFIGIPKLWSLFPPTYYLNAVYDKTYLCYMMVFSLILAILTFVLQKIKSIIKSI